MNRFVRRPKMNAGDLKLSFAAATKRLDMPLPDFDPNGLLPDGVHPATRQDLEARCVTPFSTSTTRPGILTAFSNYRDALAALGLNVTQWVDGSFVDQLRLDPEDVDVVNFGDSANLNAAAAKHGGTQILTLLDGREATKTAYKSHTFLRIHFPAGHVMAAGFESQRKYWRTWFATPQDYTSSVKVPAPKRGRKGIVQMTVGDATLCPAVSTDP